MSTETEILEFFFDFMERKITFYMCNNFSSFQGIRYLFPPTQTYAQPPAKAGLSQNFHMRKCWIFLHLYIWVSENGLFLVSFQQMCWHNEQWRKLAMTESKILSQNLNTSLLVSLYFLVLIINPFLIVDRFSLLPSKLLAIEYFSVAEFISGLNY